ncbi:MAG: DUF262 domain-containing protein [Prevotella sp.]|nr:DUF262 domain-containing protein [Prevotella sp.]
MENRIYYGEYSLKHWIEMMLRREIELPEYQRYFTWSEEKIKTLIDTFDNDEFVPPVTIGLYDHPKKGKVNYIIDGQQRLSSILLAYIGKYPDKAKYAKEVERFANDDEEEEDELKELLEWQYPALLSPDEVTSEETVRNNSNEKGYYKDLSSSIKDNKIFLNSHYMGFCYIVPKGLNVAEQRKYYSSVFRHINLQGEPLTPLESRKALYFLKDGLENFFDPDFCKSCVLPGGKKLDFVRYLSMLSQYCKNNGGTVLCGYMRKMEQYYEDYIYAVVRKTDSDTFGNCSKDIAEGYEPYMERLEEYVKSMELKDKYFSIIDMDMYFMGLIYAAFIKKQQLNNNKLASLKEDISNAINEIKQDAAHRYNPNTMRRINMRLRKSIEIYNKYVVEE